MMLAIGFKGDVGRDGNEVDGGPMFCNWIGCTSQRPERSTVLQRNAPANPLELRTTSPSVQKRDERICLRLQRSTYWSRSDERNEAERGTCIKFGLNDSKCELGFALHLVFKAESMQKVSDQIGPIWSETFRKSLEVLGGVYSRSLKPFGCGCFFVLFDYFLCGTHVAHDVARV